MSKGREDSGKHVLCVMADGIPTTLATSGTVSDRMRPWLLGVMIALLVARPLFPSESAAAKGDGQIVVMLWLVLAATWLLGAIGRRTCEIRFGWVDVAALLLIGLHTLSGIWAATEFSPRPAVNMLWEWIGLGLVFFLGRQFIRNGHEARAVVAVMIALSVAMAGYGLYQYGVELPALRTAYSVDPDRAMRAAGIWYPPGSSERAIFESRLESPEPLGTFGLTNSLAALLAPWLVMTLGIAASTGRNGRRLAALLGCALPIGCCLLLTKSRSGYIAVAVGLLLVWIRVRPWKMRLGWRLPVGAAAVVAVVVAVVAASGLGRALLDKAVKSADYRIQYWQATMAMIADAPLSGCGPGNFQDAYTRYKLPEAAEVVADPHNFLLEVWATAGTFAMLALLALLAACAWRFCRVPDDHDDDGWPTPTETPSSEVSRICVFGGVVGGFLLALPLGQISAAPPAIAATLVGLPLAVVSLVLLSGWIRSGRLDLKLPAIGAVVLLIDLLATGGIGLPGIAGSLWLLLAIGSNVDRYRSAPRMAAYGALAVVLGLTAGCYTTAYAPVLACEDWLLMAQKSLLQGQFAEAQRDLTTAAAADRWSPEPEVQLATLALSEWWRQPGAEQYDRFEEHDAAVLRLAPRSAGAWLASADRYMRVFSRTNRNGSRLQPDAIEKALERYRRAVELYPTRAIIRAKLAMAYRTVGDEASFRREADAALELDDRTPHADKKLPGDLRKELTSVASEKRLR